MYDSKSFLSLNILVRLTPPGRGAVSTLLLEGPDASTILSDLSDRPLDRIERPTFARLRLGAVAEEVVLYRVAPNTIRIHTHGGEAVVAAITERLAGVRTVPWEEYVRNRAANDANGLKKHIEAEAGIALSRARTQRTAQILLDQLGGALWKAIEAGQFEELFRWSALGLRLIEPYRVVLVGATNAGKSSLFNVLLGFARGIVDGTPGTTRDTVAVETALDGWPILLTDTAGQRIDARSDDPLERIGIERARQAALNADLLVEVVDATTGVCIEDYVALPTPRIVVFNKTDLAHGIVLPGTQVISATTGAGIDALVERIVRMLVPETPPPGQGIPFTPELVAAIRHMRSRV